MNHTHTGTEHRETPRRSHPDRDAHKQASQTDHTTNLTTTHTFTTTHRDRTPGDAEAIAPRPGRAQAGITDGAHHQSQNHTHLHTHTGTEHRETPRRSHPDRDAHKQASQTDHATNLKTTHTFTHTPGPNTGRRRGDRTQTGTRTSRHHRRITPHTLHTEGVPYDAQRFTAVLTALGRARRGGGSP